MLRQVGYSIIRLILLIRNFGTITGFRLWYQIAFNFSKHIKLRSPLFKNPVVLRKEDSDMEIFDQVFAERQYKWFGIDELQPTVIVDAGANIGLAALYFSNQFPLAKIYCVEPVAKNFELLLQNTHNYSNITALQGAVWKTNEFLEIKNPHGSSAGLSMQPAASSLTKINGYTVGSIMQKFQLKHIDILKLDIEGAEKEVFENGDTEWLKNVDILVIELHDMYKAGTAKAFFQVLHDRFEKMYFQGENIVCFLKKEDIS